jgi:hypothetical protein
MDRLRLGRLALVLVILLAGLPGSLPVQADQDEEMGSAWYLPINKQPVCVGQKVRIQGAYTLTGSPPTNGVDPLTPLVPEPVDPLAPLVDEPVDPLAPLAAHTIVNESSIGTVSPKKINVFEDSGFFEFTFTATKPGVAQIRSDLLGLPTTALLTLRVTDRCHYIYGIRADFSIDVTAGGGYAAGKYYIWSGGYLKSKDPNRPNFLMNDPQDRVILGGTLTGFQAGGCTGTGPLVPRKAPILAEGVVDEDSSEVHVTFMKQGPFAASGTWTIVCPEKVVTVPDFYAQAMIMIDGAPADVAWADAVCPADGGSCKAIFSALDFMSAIAQAGGASMLTSVEMKLEKVR